MTRKTGCTNLLLATLVMAGSGVGTFAAEETATDWRVVQVPEVWKKPPAGRGGYSWYRCLIDVPSSWQGKKLQLFVETVDDARQIFFNGQRIATAGGFPPNFRSGLGNSPRHGLDAEKVRYGETNLLALRVYNNDGRSNFNVAAPVIFASEKAIRTTGKWQFRAGDDLTWARWEGDSLDSIIRSRVQDADIVERTLLQLPGDNGPLPVAEALKQFTTSEGLIVEPVLSEPHIGQPLTMEFDERGRLWVLNYKQYPNPAGLTAVNRDKYLRTVYDKTPLPPPDHFVGKDKITIHEDSDGDGTFDRHKTFVDGLNIATSFARGRGGVFVLNPPYLLFYADRDNNDVPDGDPDVLLQGFGLEDTHSATNNLRWGPDGWLYAAQGSTVTGQVKRYGSDDKPVHSMGQLIWRYHVETGRYEVFAEGGGNTYGVEIDSKGRLFSGHNGGDTRGFHYVQGGYYKKGFGKHGALSNPFAFGYFSAMEHHSVPRFTHALVIYEGAALPAQYEGRLFSVAPLQSHVLLSDVRQAGSSFKTKDVDKALVSEDPWFRPVQIKVGPDGAVYVCDFYEQRIDHASHFQGRVTPDIGRIYRLRAADAKPIGNFDLARLTSQELLSLLTHKNKWYRQTALRLLADRRDAGLRSALEQRLEETSGAAALEYLWALNASDSFDDDVALRSVRHTNPYVRVWAIRLLCDRGRVSEAVALELALAAEQEQHVEVRCQLACSARRLPTQQALPIIRKLLDHDEDTDDVFIPLLLWWAVQAHSEKGRDAVLALFQPEDVWQLPMVQEHLAERMMRRYALAGTRQDLITCAKLLQQAPTTEDAAILLKGFQAAYAGRSMADLPDELITALADAGGDSLALQLRRHDPQAIQEALQLVGRNSAPTKERVECIRILGEIGAASAVGPLMSIIKTDGPEQLQLAALTALQQFADDDIGVQLAARWPDFEATLREATLAVLSSRLAWSKELLHGVETKTISRDVVKTAIVERMLLHNDQQLAARIRDIWGSPKTASTDAMRAEVHQLEQALANGSGNPYRGKLLYTEACSKCHQLFDQGGKIGPNLTPYKRDDLRGMLMNVVNPSLEIREGFENFVVYTTDGRALNGFIEEQDNRVVVLKSPGGQRLLIPREDIDETQQIRRSIMPEGILKPLSEQQVRDLFAYLRSTQPLP